MKFRFNFFEVMINFLTQDIVVFADVVLKVVIPRVLVKIRHILGFQNGKLTESSEIKVLTM